MLQSWQAYQALTYEQQWKVHVDKEWEKYTTEWEIEHPDEKPPKRRIQFMTDFMKEKYENETDEMKARCETYRRARKEDAELNESDANRNLLYQLYVYVPIFARHVYLTGDFLEQLISFPEHLPHFQSQL